MGNLFPLDDDYRRTNPTTLKTIASRSKYQTPREIYKSLTKEDSFNGPKDFKQCQNVGYNERKKEKTTTGRKDNFADELLECMELVDSDNFVQHVSKSKGKLPNFVLYSDDQIDDFYYFVSHQGSHVLGLDRTFNLGHFFVTSFVYKNLRLVRSDKSDEHPLFAGPIFLHRDATFQAYNFFLSTVKAVMCEKFSFQTIQLNIEKSLVFGSDEEQAITKAIESVFPSSNRTLCTKHLKDNVVAFMQHEAGVPQKKRYYIAEKIFGDDGMSAADNSTLFDKRSSAVLKEAKSFPKFLSYFRNKINPVLKSYVVEPAIRNNLKSNWTNNNCESLNHIMKLDAKWKKGSTRELIALISEIISLQFRDFRRSLYGSGNYRLVFVQKKRFGIAKDVWVKMSEDQKSSKFQKFLKNQYKRKTDIVKSTFSTFAIRKPTIAKKPGQKKRVRPNRTNNRK